MDQLGLQVARRTGVALRLQSLLRFAGLPLVETTIRAGALARLQLLAAPALVRPDGTVVPLERKDAALLALLAFDGPTSRSRAAALLWPDADADKARNSLRQRLFRLRRAAGIELIEPDESLRLADRIEHNLGSPARHLADDPTAAAGDLLGACVYEDCPELEDWVRIAREHWRAMRRDALAELAAKREADGQIAQALVYAERLLAEDPVSEQAHRLAMRLHYRRGDRAAALAAYDRCRTALQRELAAKPDAETIALSQLIRRADDLPGVATKARRHAAVLRPPRLIGRDAEWRALERSWDAGRPVLISGDAGLGKSRLLGDFAQARRVTVVGGRPGDARVPYALLARLLRAALRIEGTDRLDNGLDKSVKSELARVLPELGEAPLGPLVEARFRSAVVQALSSRQSAGLAGLAVDDLHFADDATLELLPQLVIPDLRWIGAVRAAECPASITAWLRAEGGQRLDEVPIRPLDANAVRELLESLALPEIDAAALAGAIARHTGGNPFFILETLNALLEAGGAGVTSNRLPTPTSVGALIERRLAQLSAAALKLARVAALAGADFSAALAAHVLQTHPLDLAEAWSELETAQVIRDDAFAHDLVFEAALRGVPEPIARVIHQDIAVYLTACGAAPHVSAHHWFAAGHKQMAAAQFAAAARQSFESSRFGEAGELFERAADCYAAVGDVDEQHRSLQEVAGCRMKAFDLVGARQTTELLRDIAQTDAQSGWALDRLIDTLNFSRADDALAEASARAMLNLGRASADHWMVFNATRKLAIALAQRGRRVEALQCFDTQRDWIQSNEEQWNVDVWFCDRAFVLELANQRNAAAVAYQQALTMARAHENWHAAYAAQRNLSHLYWWTGDLGKAVAQSDAAVRYSERLGDPMVDRNPRDAPRRAAILRDAGRFAEALELLLLARGELTRGDCPYWLAYCEDQLAQLFIALGQPGRVQPLMESNVEALPPEVRVWRALLQGRLARRVSHDALRWSRQAQKVSAEPACPERWRLLAALDLARDVDAAEALNLSRTATKEASRLECSGIRLHALARTACGTRQSRAAMRLARDAIELAENGIAPTGLLMPEFFLCLYDALTVAEDAGGALQMLRRGVAWINEVALPNVPVEFRDSFINRNPVNRTILTTASRNR